MQLTMWSCNSANEVMQDDENEVFEVSSRYEATAKLVEDLYQTASDEFMHKALTAWFTSGSITMLEAGKDVFWNVVLVDNDAENN